MSIKYILRKKNGIAKINFRYRQGRDVDIVLSTPFSINTENWDLENECYKESLKKKSVRNEIDKNFNLAIDQFNIKLKEFKIHIEQFIISQDYRVNSDNLKNYINSKYTLKKKIVKENTIPSLFSDFVTYYIEQKSQYSLGKQKPITQGTIKKYGVVKNKVKKIDSKLKISDINDNFRDKFTQWNVKNKYSITTIVKELKIIKGFVKFAENKKLKVSIDVKNWTFHIPQKDYWYPSLDHTELKKISEKVFDLDYLDNARDWLLIGCYTGQRVSDLLNINSSMIIKDNFLSFKQKKTDTNVTIFLLPQVKKILEKRNGEFPRKISDQRFNEFIKIVCEKAGINKPMRGGKMINKRKIIDIYPKWELVTSHICRRTYVTLFRHLFGDEGIMINTGHKSINMLETYDQNNDLEKALKFQNKIHHIIEQLESELN
ncbi:phage integrase SAM-like domain-containing protein [Chryseobacterium ginsenosidimutans]|uniref:phage integrase SAM-like domain-containing protein n=1 Tax=Chryseobacterium ginsenosidimutans TaxID=687846 RepID=UPI0031DE4905